MCGCKWRGVVWSVNVFMCMCMKPIGSKTISVQEQGGNNSTQDEYKHRVEGRDWLAARKAQQHWQRAIVSVIRRKQRMDLLSGRRGGTRRLRQTMWETDRQHTPVWRGSFVLSSTRFGYTCLSECFHSESLTQKEYISAQVPTSVTRTEKGSKLSFTLAVFASKQIILSVIHCCAAWSEHGVCVESECTKLRWGRWANFVLPASRHSCVPLCAQLHKQVGLHSAWLCVHLWSVTFCPMVISNSA